MDYSDKVTIIIPTYKRPQFIERAIESCLEQIAVNVEIIVIDDNGLGTLEQIQMERTLSRYIHNGSIKYIAHKINRRAAVARNTGIKNATGKYLAFLDDDDWFETDKLYSQIQTMEETQSGACICGFRRIYANKKVDTIPDLRGDLNFELLSFNIDHCAGSTLLIKKEVVDEINGFDETFVRHQDIEFIYRVSKATEICVVPKILVNIYMHKENTMKKDAHYLRDNRIHFVDTFWEDINKLEKQKKDRVLDVHYVEIAKAYMKQYLFLDSVQWILKTSDPLKSLCKVGHDALVHLTDRWEANS